jgi:ABC-type phosphate transport system auxiliary subunit
MAQPTNGPLPVAATSRHRSPWIFVAAGAGGIALLIVILIGIVLVLHYTGAERDAHAKAACSLMQQADDEGLFDAVISQIKAVEEAKKSENKELRAAANKTSPASELPSDNPLYENPGDVQANAVRAWCRANPR